MNNGLGQAIVLSEFFTLSALDGCTMTCNYGDTCGADTTLTATVPPSVAIFTEPSTLVWEQSTGNPMPFDGLSALNNIVAGYGTTTPIPICLYCTSNNAATNSPF